MEQNKIEIKHVNNAEALLKVTTPTKLCRLLQVSLFDLQTLINEPAYNHFQISKKRGGKRNIYAPNNHLKQAQKILNYYLQAYYLCIKPENVHGFVINPHYLGKTCNILTNAKIHVGQKHLLTIDLEEFFPSIKAYQVKQLFTSSRFNYNEDIANALALLCTYKRALPIGAPTSPVLANFICLNLDENIKSFCIQHHINYSRYADDLSFSSNEIITEEIKAALFSIIQNQGFVINNQKVRIRSYYQKQVVTGITVNEFPNVNRTLLKKIRAMLHDFNENGLEHATQKHFNLLSRPTASQNSSFINRLRGYINFVGQVKGESNINYSEWKSNFQAMVSYEL